MVKIPFSNTRCRAWHRKSQTFKFVILTDWSTLLFSVRVTQSCKFASFKYKADGLMHAPPKLNSLMLVGDNYQLNSFQPTMGYQRDKGNFVTLHNLQVHWNYSWGADLWFRDMFLWYICSLQARWISLTRVCRALCGMRGCHSAPCAQGDCFKRLLGSQIEIKKKKILKVLWT